MYVCLQASHSMQYDFHSEMKRLLKTAGTTLNRFEVFFKEGSDIKKIALDLGCRHTSYCHNRCNFFYCGITDEQELRPYPRTTPPSHPDTKFIVQEKVFRPRNLYSIAAHEDNK
jgi:hypothetical protein